MALNPLDIVSLDRMKQELRLGGNTTQTRAKYAEQDDHIIGIIASAVSIMTGFIGRPLVDIMETISLTPPYGIDDPLRIPANHVKSVERIDYWGPSSSLRDMHNAHITTSDLGRLVEQRDGSSFIWPPAEGWPERLRGSVFEVTVTRGIDFPHWPDKPAIGSPPSEIQAYETAVADRTHSIRRAIVIVARHLYDGTDPDMGVVQNIVSSWRSAYGPGPTGAPLAQPLPAPPVERDPFRYWLNTLPGITEVPAATIHQEFAEPQVFDLPELAEATYLYFATPVSEDNVHSIVFDGFPSTGAFQQVAVGAVQGTTSPSYYIWRSNNQLLESVSGAQIIIHRN